MGFFGSIKIAIGLWVVLIAACILGTFKMDVFSSLWFVLIFVPFFLNLIACSLKRPSLIHIAILLIFSGGLVSRFFGFKEYIKAYEGEMLRVPHRDVFLHILDFNIEYYPNSFIPKNYKTKLLIIDKGTTLERTLRVNHPLFYKGIGFYQKSYEIKGCDSYYTELEVVNDPGVFIVFLGFGLLVFGLSKKWIFSFFFP